VELFGVIYIYNPPAPEILGLDAASVEKLAGAAAPDETTVKPSESPATVPAVPAGRSTTPPVGPPSPPPTGN
jgi:hypothetical protein